MKVLLQLCLLLQKLIRTTNTENEVMFKLITDKQIHTLKYYDHNGKKINSLRNAKDTCEKNTTISDKILWNQNLPKPFCLNVFYHTNKENKFKIEFNNLKNDVLYHVFIESKNTKISNIKFIKGSIRTKEKVIMKTSFDPLNQNANDFTVSNTPENLELLNTSVRYCSLIEQIVYESKILRENLREILFEIKDFEKVYNDLSINYNVEKVENVYSYTMYKLINHIFYNLSRLYFIESIKDDLLKFEELEKLLEKIYCEISEKITYIKEKIANNNDEVIFKNLEKKYIADFKSRIENLTKFKSLYSAIQSTENIIKSVEKAKSAIQETKIIKSIKLNNMENFYKFYIPLIKNTFELISKKHLENRINNTFEDEYYKIIHNDFDQLESDSYDFVFFKCMKYALKSYENNPRHLKFIFFFEHFLSMKVSSLIASLEKEKTFYEKVLLKLDTNADEKIIVYIKSILDNIKICSKAWKDINKAGSFLKKVKEKSMLDLIRESKDDAKLPYNDKLNYKTPVFYNFDENVEKINDDTFYGPTKDDILESLQYKKTFNSLNGDNMQNLKINESSEMVLSYAKEIILPSDEIVEILPIKSYGNIQKQTEHQTEQNTYFEPIATTITNLEPQKNVDEKHEENMDQHNIIENSPVTYQTFFENLIEDMKTSYYKINYPDKDLFDYQEEYSLKSLPVNNSLEDLVQLKSTNELYNYSPPGSSKDEQDLFYKNSTPSTSRDQSYLYLPSTSTNTNTDLSSFKPQDIPPFNGDVNQYNSSDSLSSDASNFSKEHSDGGLEKKLHADFITGHKEQITDQNDSLLQKNMIGRRSKSELFNGVRDRSAKKKSKNKSNRKRSNSLPCLRNKEEFLKYYNVPHENNFYYDSALGISLDTSYDSTPEDCLFDLYTDSDQTERYNAVNLLNTWVDIKKLDSEGDMVIEDDNQTIKNDSNDNEIFNNNERRSETLNNEDEKEDLLSKENIKYTEIKGLEVKKSDEKIALIPGEINQSDIIKSNDQNLNILQLEDDKHIENQVTKNESYGSEANAIDKSIVNIKEQTDNLATINFNLNENSNNTTLINTESIKVTNISESNSFKDPKVSPTVLEVLNESKEINIGDNFFKRSSVEDLDIIDTPGLQLSDTIDESNLKNPRSPNENNFVTIIVNQQDLNNSKEKRLTKLNSEFVNSPVNNSSVVKNDVSDSNQIDMLSKNAPSINILEQVITSTLKDDSLPSTMLKQIENLPLKHDNLPSKSVEQVIKSPIKVLKDDKSPSKTSEQINILLSKDDSLPSKVSEQVIKTPAKISEQVIKSPQKVSKEDNLLSKGDSLPSKVPEQAINVPSITLEQGIKPPQKVSKDDNLLLKDDNLLSKGDSLPSKISEQVIKPPSELSEQVIRSTLKGNNFPSKILEQDMKSTSKISEQAIRSPLKDNNFPPKISEQAVKSTSKPSEQAIKSPSKISEQVIKSPLKDNNLPFKVSERVIKSPSKDSEEVIKPPSRPSEQVIKSPLNPSEQVINVSSKVSKDDILPLNVSKADNLPLKISEQVINVSSKVSKDNNLPLKVSKVDRLLSKVSEQDMKSPSKPSEQAIKSPSKISEQVIRSPLKDNNFPSKISEQAAKPPSKLSEQVMNSPTKVPEQVIKTPSKPSEQAVKPPSKLSEQVMKSPSKVPEQVIKSTSKPSEQAAKPPSKLSEQVIRSPLKDNNLQSKSSNEIKNSNSNNSARVSGKSPAEKVNQENLKNPIDKNKNASSAQNAKEQKPINKNATKPAEKEKNKPSTIRIAFGFSRR